MEHPPVVGGGLRGRLHRGSRDAPWSIRVTVNGLRRRLHRGAALHSGISEAGNALRLSAAAPGCSPTLGDFGGRQCVEGFGGRTRVRPYTRGAALLSG